MRPSSLRLPREVLERLGEVVCVLERLGYERVYLTGGAAEGRLTAESDIDLVILLDHEPGSEEAVSIRERILEALEEEGIPLYLPIEFHLVGPQRVKRYRTLRRLACRASEPRG